MILNPGCAVELPKDLLKNYMSPTLKMSDLTGRGVAQESFTKLSGGFNGQAGLRTLE